MSLDERNAELDKALEVNPIDEQIAALARSDQSRRRQITWLTISLVLDVLLTIGFGYTTLRANTAASQAETIEHAITARCENTNHARIKNEKLWDHILEITKDTPRTSQQEADRAEFIKVKEETFAPTDCSMAVEESVEK